MLEVVIEGRCYRGSGQADAQAKRGGVRGYVREYHRINVHFEVDVVHVFAGNPVCEESDEARLDYHEDFDRLRCDRFLLVSAWGQQLNGPEVTNTRLVTLNLGRLYP